MTTDQGKAVLAALAADPELRALSAASAPSCPTGATLAALSVPYRLAGRDVPPPTLAAIAVLSLIRSPLLAGAEAMEPMDCWRALWALICDPRDLGPLYGLDARIRALAKHGSALGMDAPAIAEAQARATAEAFAPVDRRAVEVAARYSGASAQEIADLVQRMVSDVTGAWALMPRAEGGRGDGGDPSRSTAIGWGGFLTWLRRPAWRFARATCGLFLRRGWAC